MTTRVGLAALVLAALAALAACGTGSATPGEPAADTAVNTAVNTAASATTTPSAPAPATSATPRTSRTSHPGRAHRREVRVAKARRAHLAQQAQRSARTARAAANPLAGRYWATYEGDQDLAWEPYAHATGQRRSDLAAIALTPKAKWFGYWIPNSDIAAKVHAYVAEATAGHPGALVQMTLFRMVPWEHDTCNRLPSPAEQASYRDWIDRFATALGSTHAAIVLQPDGPFALCAPHGSALPEQLISYSAQRLSALPHTSVYVEAGAADWPAAGQGGVDQALRFLVPDGVQYARGFALNTTHYSSTADSVAHCAAVAEALAARGITGKHCVINTAMNGVPHDFGADHSANPNYPPVCRSASDPTPCVALGIPPTSDVADPRWGLAADVAAQATGYVDAYLWVGRPWLYRGATPFVMDRALALVHTAPYRDLLPR